MSSRSRIAYLISSALVFGSCAHGSSVEGPPRIGRATEGQPLPELPPDSGGPPIVWSDMSHDQRAAYMTERVLPTMKPLFSAFDPERYEDMSCSTCHGPGARVHGFRMPNPALPVLPVPESAAWRAMMTEQRHVFDFMAERVEPAMANLLGVPVYDPQTGEGFGCFKCHTMAEH